MDFLSPLWQSLYKAVEIQNLPMHVRPQPLYYDMFKVTKDRVTCILMYYKQECEFLINIKMFLYAQRHPVMTRKFIILKEQMVY